MIDLRLGDYREVLRDVECDSLITDPPFSSRTDEGYFSHGLCEVARKDDIGYRPITEEWCREFAKFWEPRTKKWVVIWSDHISFRWHEGAWQSLGWLTFAPVIWVKRGAAPRFSGDGPGSHAEHILIARRRGIEKCGAKPGWYIADTIRAGHGYTGVTGNKDPVAMEAVILDYSLAGETIADPCAGSGTTLWIAEANGRRAVGAEMDPETWKKAMNRTSPCRQETLTTDWIQNA